MKSQIIDIGGDDPHKRIKWYCPGCKCDHGVPVPPHAHAWDWNGSLESPTLSPSVLVTFGRYPRPDLPQTCHCFVRDGKIEFLSDCEHELAGKTVEMKTE